MLFLFTALPKHQVQAFRTSALHRAVVLCDSTVFSLSYDSVHADIKTRRSEKLTAAKLVGQPTFYMLHAPESL